VSALSFSPPSSLKAGSPVTSAGVCHVDPVCSNGDAHHQAPPGKAALDSVPEIQPMDGSIPARSAGGSSTWMLKQPLLPESFRAASKHSSPPMAHYQGFDHAGSNSLPRQDPQNSIGSQSPQTLGQIAPAQPQSVPEIGGQIPSRQQPDRTGGGEARLKQGARHCNRTAQGDCYPVRSVDVNCSQGRAGGDAWSPPHTCVHCGHGEALQVCLGCCFLQKEGLIVCEKSASQERMTPPVGPHT